MTTASGRYGTSVAIATSLRIPGSENLGLAQRKTDFVVGTKPRERGLHLPQADKRSCSERGITPYHGVLPVTRPRTVRGSSCVRRTTVAVVTRGQPQSRRPNRFPPEAMRTNVPPYLRIVLGAACFQQQGGAHNPATRMTAVFTVSAQRLGAPFSIRRRGELLVELQRVSSERFQVRRTLPAEAARATSAMGLRTARRGLR